jgi:hypothetical protein
VTFAVGPDLTWRLSPVRLSRPAAWFNPRSETLLVSRLLDVQTCTHRVHYPEEATKCILSVDPSSRYCPRLSFSSLQWAAAPQTTRRLRPSQGETKTSRQR